jgi:hypothetical protein
MSDPTSKKIIVDCILSQASPMMCDCMQPSHPHNILPYSHHYMKVPRLGIKYGYKHSSPEDKTIERTVTTLSTFWTCETHKLQFIIYVALLEPHQ